ncbi:hypothetical protein A9P82_12900 [Arachidicoccus ginsenosidimutans]|uniref:RNA polymerase sigma factor n=1 Tax=Arachidicoccus sp. BS20 TaxID=1850526 RepID=UPI0007F14D94|nr:sigma-70 family RNA polymerase sigma factor [Arachidicoccus sp. BS20]ANI90102.1 hypothetical protein A9P82_12900 [Arachidicoccus sp. BS20]
MNEQRIIHGCIAGDKNAQKIIFEKYAALMMSVCTRYIKNMHDAEELMLSGFLQFFNRLEKFEYRGEGSVRAWLQKIMLNECLMFLRKENNFQLAKMEDDLLQENTSAIDKLSADEIFSLILKLPVGYRTVFNLYVIEGMSHKEIARELNISEGTSKSQLSKARTMLQQMILKNENYGQEG